MNTSLSYFNTNNESGEVLKNSEIQARNQEDLILSLFRQYDFRNFTPFEVSEKLRMINTLITSIRRAMTNLTKKGFLVKDVEMRRGIFGKLNYCWELKK